MVLPAKSATRGFIETVWQVDLPSGHTTLYKGSLIIETQEDYDELINGEINPRLVQELMVMALEACGFIRFDNEKKKSVNTR